MEKFVPGKIVHTFRSKKGNEIVLRYPKKEDLDELTRYINELSKEDTFILFSGEEITKEYESEFLEKTLKNIEEHNQVMILAFADNKLIGNTGIERITANKKRGLHTALFGISLAYGYRDEGIGTQLSETVIEEAKKNISDLKIIILDVFETNPRAKKLYENLGFKTAGMIPNALLYKGEYIGEVKMYLEV